MNSKLANALLVAYGVAVGCTYAAVVWSASGNVTIGVVTAITFPMVIATVAWQVSKTANLPVGQKLLMIALSPVVFLSAAIVLAVMPLILLLFIPYACVAGLRKMRRDSKLMQYLAKQGRLLLLSQLEARLQAGEGTLLEETGPKGVDRIWWTNDDISSFAPSIPARERFVQLLEGNDTTGFNQLCLETYISESQGKAYLTSIRPRHARSGYLDRRFPKMMRVMVVRLEHAR